MVEALVCLQFYVMCLVFRHIAFARLDVPSSDDLGTLFRLSFGSSIGCQ